MPGVPHEMREMFERAILPELLRRGGDPSVIVSRVLRTWGESESGLNERLDGVIAELDEPGNPTLAFLASGWDGLKIRLTAKAGRPRRRARPCSTSGSGASGRSSASSCSGSTTTRWSRSCSTCCAGAA